MRPINWLVPAAGDRWERSRRHTAHKPLIRIWIVLIRGRVATAHMTRHGRRQSRWNIRLWMERIVGHRRWTIWLGEMRSSTWVSMKMRTKWNQWWKILTMRWWLIATGYFLTINRLEVNIPIPYRLRNWWVRRITEPHFGPLSLCKVSDRGRFYKRNRSLVYALLETIIKTNPYFVEYWRLSYLWTLINIESSSFDLEVLKRAVSIVQQRTRRGNQGNEASNDAVVL